MEKVYNKLVRDNVLEIIKSNNSEPIFRILNDDEYKEELYEKLKEEVLEFIMDENMEEIADIIEVLLAIISYKNFDIQKIASLKNLKAIKNGKFNNKIFLEKVISKD